MPIGKDVQPGIIASGTGAVCYAVENHPCDSRVRIDETGTCQTLSARCGTGGQRADGID